MIHIDLFSGISGPSLAAGWLGWETAITCDINEFTAHVMKFYHPNAYHHTDIRTLTGKIIDDELTKRYGPQWRERSVLTAGFPCQPFSVAGQRTGQDHDSYLWPETLRVVSEVRPRWFIGENVNGIVSMVFPGEEVEMGYQADIFGAENTVYERTDEYIIDRICRDLEQIGYEVQPVVIPACAVGAPHERMRVFFLCHDATDSEGNGWRSSRSGQGCEMRERDILSREQHGSTMRRSVDRPFIQQSTSDRTDAGAKGVQESQVGIHATGIITDREGAGLQREVYKSEQARARIEGATGRYSAGSATAYGNGIGLRQEVDGHGESRFINLPCAPNDWQDFPTQSPVCCRDDGFSDRLSREAVFVGVRDNGRKSTNNRWREKSIEAFGNAIVPQVMFEILRMIERINRLKLPVKWHEYEA